MGFWEKAKSAISSSLDYVEGKVHTGNYVLHPDHAYLGQRYYCKESKLPPQTAGSLDSMGPSGADAGSGLPPAATPHTLRTTSSLLSKEQERAMKRVQPHVRISAKSVPTPLRMPEDRYVVMRHRDLINDDKVDATVGRDRNLYWAIKAAVVLIIKERSEAQIVAIPPRGLSADSERLRSTVGDNGQEDVTIEKTPIDQNISSKIGSTKTSQALPWSVEGFGDAEIVSSAASEGKKKNPAPAVKIGAKARNLLESRSVEDFFADSPREVIDTFPTNPLLALPRSSSTAVNAQAGKDCTNPLDHIPWTELVIVFRRDTKELFARKEDGRLYPVLWKGPATDKLDEEAWEVVDMA